MSEPIDDAQPYVAFPPSIAEESGAIIHCFSGVPELEVVSTDRVPVLNMAAPGAAEAAQIAHWVINFGPQLLSQLAAPGLLFFAAKKFVEGAAGEAGKDFWKGVKDLAEFVRQRVQRQPAGAAQDSFRYMELRASGSISELPAPLSVSIGLIVPDDQEALTRRLTEVESIILPLIGCLAMKLGRISFSADWEEESWKIRLSGRGIFVIQAAESTFREWGSRRDRAVPECLERLGLRPAAIP